MPVCILLKLLLQYLLNARQIVIAVRIIFAFVEGGI